MAGSIKYFPNSRELELGQIVRALFPVNQTRSDWVCGTVKGFRGSLVLVEFEGIPGAPQPLKRRWMLPSDLATVEDINI